MDLPLALASCLALYMKLQRRMVYSTITVKPLVKHVHRACSTHFRSSSEKNDGHVMIVTVLGENGSESESMGSSLSSVQSGTADAVSGA